MKVNRLRLLLVGVLIAALGIVGISFSSATASAAGDEICVPADAWTEVIEHPAETKVVHHEALVVTEWRYAKFTRIKHKHPDSLGFWKEFSPTEPKTFTGPPAYPSDERGKWSEPKYEGGPQQDASGVFQQGGGNGSWFYRQAGATTEWTEFGPSTIWGDGTTDSQWRPYYDTELTEWAFHGQGTYDDGTKWYREWRIEPTGDTRETVIREAYDETVIVKEAWTETIEHPAVVCDEPTDEPTPTEEPTSTPSETPTTPAVPTETPSTTPTVTPEVPTETDNEVLVICGITIQPVEPGQPVPRDILCSLEEHEDVVKNDPVVQTHTSNQPTRTVKRYTHESGVVTKTVVVYDDYEDVTEEGY